ncbi:MAG: T9SS type A sorting domain-containing protein, partial [Bacteroidetes bacterium]|nr:T9SS type A sorting domain-containing protein [Bacteroidota bacterium]
PAPGTPLNFYITGGIGESPTLHWDPNLEIDLNGYKIYYSIDGGPWYLLTTVDKNTTSFTDPGVTITGGRFDPRVCYTILAFDLAGNESPQFGIPRCVLSNQFQKKTEGQASIFEYSLSEAFPNPFNPITKIKYSIGKNGFVTIRVLDVLGNVVTQLIEEEKSAGEYSVNFDGSNLTSGIYFYRITSGKFTATKKLILLK